MQKVKPNKKLFYQKIKIEFFRTICHLINLINHLSLIYWLISKIFRIKKKLKPIKLQLKFFLFLFFFDILQLKKLKE
jgi:hypothetical protein